MLHTAQVTAPIPLNATTAATTQMPVLALSFQRSWFSQVTSWGTSGFPSHLHANAGLHAGKNVGG